MDPIRAAVALWMGALLSLLLFSPLECRKGESPELSALQEELIGPWFTGPLVSPSGHVVPKGFYNIEPYLLATAQTGHYDQNWAPHSTPNFYSINPFFYIQLGLTENADISLGPQFFYNHTEGQSSTQLGDLPIALDFQLLNDAPHRWYPAIKFTFQELFPLGKYQKLNPHKLQTDIGGQGSFVSTAALVFSRLFHLKNTYYLSSRLAFAYSVSAPVRVQGFNFYGGGYKTRGKVFPGNLFSTFLGLELSFTKNWVLALDIVNICTAKTRFSGRSGFIDKSHLIPASVKNPSSNQISLAPALEYNFSENLGIIAGCWFSVAGRNSLRFASGVIAFNYYAGHSAKKR